MHPSSCTLCTPHRVHYAPLIVCTIHPSPCALPTPHRVHYPPRIVCTIHPSSCALSTPHRVHYPPLVVCTTHPSSCALPSYVMSNPRDHTACWGGGIPAEGGGWTCTCVRAWRDCGGIQGLITGIYHQMRVDSAHNAHQVCTIVDSCSSAYNAGLTP